MKRIGLFVVLVLLALGLTACPATEAETPDPKTISEEAVANEDLSILVEALTEANLVDTLKGVGPFTVFAPTDDAFAALLTELGVTKEELLALPELADILKYHVVSGSAKAADLTNGQALTSLQGATITVAVANGKVSLTDGRGRTANVTTADVSASNGVIHVIDKVILPPVPPAPITVEVSLSGSQEVPPLTNPGSFGGATVTLDGKTLTVDGTYSGFSATLAHIHGPAQAGASAPPIFDMTENIDDTAKTFTGEFTLTDAQVTEFKSGLYYLNVHSTTNSGGEIRGQILPPTE